MLRTKLGNTFRPVYCRPFLTQRISLLRRTFHAGPVLGEGEPLRRRTFPRPALIALSLLPLAAYAVWEWYTYSTIPPTARRPLRLALLKHYYTNDAPGAVANYLDAVDQCLLAGLPANSNEVTGIKLRLAELHATHRSSPREALALYASVLGALQARVKAEGPTAHPSQQNKLVGIAHKMGDEYLKLGNLGAARASYEWSVRKMLGFNEPPPRSPFADVDSASGAGGGDAFVADEQSEPYIGPTDKPVQLPNWVSPTEIGAAMEALAGIYSRQKLPELALSVYIRALEILDTDASLSTSERACRKAILQNNIAEAQVSLARSAADPALRAAYGWARKAAASAKLSGGLATCAECSVCAECNMGTIARMLGEHSSAKKHFLSCRDMAAEAGYTGGIIEAREGLRALSEDVV
ncbi:hypothetical protein HDU87_000541 [Geranomyces variabilis]|uniref:Uncharacterized protein n=1 Tax=Geranomyces variabilis TaxID=109894 RepID=A0AAD5XIN4_9FUNG|nr:hypothetical protein HDU87_000541 [Geranomyces variabilis]